MLDRQRFSCLRTSQASSLALARKRLLTSNSGPSFQPPALTNRTSPLATFESVSMSQSDGSH